MSEKNSNQRLRYYFSKNKNSESLQISYLLFTLVQVRSQSELNKQDSTSASVSPDAVDIEYIAACIRNLKLN
jgi:hypothetical protein